MPKTGECPESIDVSPPVSENPIPSIDPEKFKYLLGQLHRPNEKFDRGQLEQIISDWYGDDPVIKQGARTLIKQLEQTYTEMQKLARESEIPYDDPRSYFDMIFKKIEDPMSKPNYEPYKDAVDWHDLVRNKELSEGFELLGISKDAVGENFIRQFLLDQISNPANLKNKGTVKINCRLYETRKYSSVMTGPSGKKMIIESWWTIKDGKMELGTMVQTRPPLEYRVPKKNPERVNSDWVDRLITERLLIPLLKIFNFQKVF